MDLGKMYPGSAFLALIKDKDFGPVSAFSRKYTNPKIGFRARGQVLLQL